VCGYLYKRIDFRGRVSPPLRVSRGRFKTRNLAGALTHTTVVDGEFGIPTLILQDPGILATGYSFRGKTSREQIAVPGGDSKVRTIGIQDG